MNLHSINPPRPYDHIPLLTLNAYVELDNFYDGYIIPGTLHETWVENDQLLGYWSDNEYEYEFIILVWEHNQTPAAREQATKELRELGWYLSDYHILETRP